MPKSRDADFGGLPPEPLLCLESEARVIEVDNLLFDVPVYTFDRSSEWRGEYHFTPDVVREYNRIILKGVYASAGHYRTRFVSAGDLVPPNYRQIPILVVDMCKIANELVNEPFRAAAYLLWRANWIHPFTDGNGRTARELCSLALQVGVPDESPEIWELVNYLIGKEYRSQYFESLMKTDRIASQSNELNVTPVEDLLYDIHFRAHEIKLQS